MVIVSYDISDNLIRSRFQKMLTKNGAIRLQYSVYEVVNTKRIIENIKLKIAAYSKHFSADDSVVIFEVDKNCLTKYGNAIHRDTDIVFF
ncbi:MAG: CRISPR-associated endonuclease Cas2 [Phocaeicola sp.]|nr:CRISPR-associated endonuclease Cas2 [Phocaeicola sp.]